MSGHISVKDYGDRFHVSISFVNGGGHVSGEVDKYSTETWEVHGTLYHYDENGKRIKNEDTKINDWNIAGETRHFCYNSSMDIVTNDFIGAKSFSEYVSDNFGDKQDLTVEDFERLFLIFIKDFYSYKLSLDHLSNYASWISDRTVKMDVSYGNILVSAFELTYYIRKIDYSGRAGEQFISFLTEVKQYFEQNKHKLDDK